MLVLSLSSDTFGTLIKAFDYNSLVVSNFVHVIFLVPSVRISSAQTFGYMTIFQYDLQKMTFRLNVDTLYPCHTYRRSAGDRCALLDFEHFHKAQ